MKNFMIIVVGMVALLVSSNVCMAEEAVTWNPEKDWDFSDGVLQFEMGIGLSHREGMGHGIGDIIGTYTLGMEVFDQAQQKGDWFSGSQSLEISFSRDYLELGFYWEWSWFTAPTNEDVYISFGLRVGGSIVDTTNLLVVNDDYVAYEVGGTLSVHLDQQSAFRTWFMIGGYGNEPLGYANFTNKVGFALTVLFK